MSSDTVIEQSNLGIAWGVLHDKLSDMTEEELLRHFPDCRPPDFIASKVHAGIDRRTDAMKTTGADSVRMLPSRHGRDHPVHRAVVLGLRAADRVLVGGAGLLFRSGDLTVLRQGDGLLMPSCLRSGMAGYDGG